MTKLDPIFNLNNLSGRRLRANQMAAGICSDGYIQVRVICVMCVHYH